MNVRSLIGAIAVGAMVASSTASALADQTASNYLMAKVASHVGTAILTLDRNQLGYGGHRVKAIGYLRSAYSELRSAEQYAQSNGYGQTKTIPPAPAPQSYAPSQRFDRATSNQTIVNSQRNIPNWITQLQGGAEGYGGRRIAAINYLQQALNELNLAVQWTNTHG